jgi:hypothetical protein
MVRLSHGVSVTAELLGSSWTIGRRISGVLVLPKPPPDFDAFAWALDPPPIAGAEQALEWLGKSRAGETHGLTWGRGFEGRVDTRSVTKAYVRSAVLVLPAMGYDTESDGRAQLDSIASEMDAFIDDLCEWLHVLGGEVEEDWPRESGGTPRHVFPLALALTADGGVGHLPTIARLPTMSQTTNSYGGSRATEPGVWRDAFDRTNASVRPPEEHLLLRDSRGALLRGDGRKAIVDATTAVEVALARAIRGRMTTAPGAESVEQVLKNTSGVVELFDLAIALGVHLPVSRGRVIGQLAGRRNEAVHQGVDPDDVAVGEAQKTAKVILDAASPL